MLYTNLKHIESPAEYARIISENGNVMLICGSMGPLCIAVYRIAEELEQEYRPVKFYDMEYDHPELTGILTLPELKSLSGVPYIIYYKNGNIVKATSGLQTKAQVTAILDQEFAATIKA
jgi:thioredoxin 1